MGMAASQARFLSLTARKTNVEFEGQQINQQRTALSNSSSTQYAKLNTLDVPTPPSASEYVKTVYSFNNGTDTNIINTIVASTEGKYRINYTTSYQTESMVSNGSVIVSRQNYGTEDNPNYGYSIGSTHLRILTDSNSIANDPYYKNLSEDAKKDALALEKNYLGLLRKKYGEDSDWYVKYQLNSETNVYTPVFYNAREVQKSLYTDEGNSFTGIKSYVYGQTQETREFKNVLATLTQDSQGRYLSVFIYDEDGKGVEYPLEVNTEADDTAYNDAMNRYHYNKTLYDKEIQDINSQIKVIQNQDKNLELRLKQLDTEQNAISTEMEAIKKVISKNVTDTFKIFEA